jgi:O-methyltransferase
MLVRTDLANKYIELLKKSLLNELYLDNEARILFCMQAVMRNSSISFSDVYDIARQKELINYLQQTKEVGGTFTFNLQNADGSTSPAYHLRNFTELSHTMIGRKRMDNLQFCLETALDEDIPGDLIETGIWRGGATIFMRGVLQAYGITDRVVWGADSFKGVPPPSLPEDEGFDISAAVYPFLKVSIVQVWELFEKYDLLNDQVKFLKGWFKDTLPTAPIENLALLRLDGDLYESTMDALNPLYGKVSQGGFIIVDDYFSCPPCMLAINEFRQRHDIRDELVRIDEQSAYWRKRQT